MRQRSSKSQGVAVLISRGFGLALQGYKAAARGEGRLEATQPEARAASLASCTMGSSSGI